MHVHVMCSSWHEARKSRMVGSECKKKVSMRAYTVGERKECGCIGVEYMRLHVQTQTQTLSIHAHSPL